MIDVEQVTEPLADHGEGPIWDAAAGRLRWVDMLAGDLLGLDPATGEVTRLHVGTVAAVARPRAGGGLVLALERQFALLDPDGTLRPLDELWTDAGIRFNEGGCDRAGRFYCGSMAYDQSGAPPVGVIHRLDPDLSTSTVLTGAVISNGLAWTPDGATAYYVDSPTHRVDAFDAGADGSLTGRRTVVRVADGAGDPDGLTIDAEGGIWVAMWNGSAVHRYLPDGTLDTVVAVPAHQVTACAFGGPDLTDLYITTSRYEIPAAEAGPAGALLRCRPGVAGVAETPFAA